LLSVVGEVRADAAADRAAAQAAFAEARRLRGAGDRAQAIVQFRRAHQLAPTPVTRLELARELASAGQLVEAEALAATAASLPVTATETGKSKLARTEATAFAAALAARVPVLRLAFVPAGAEPEVAIDGSPVSKELLAGGEVRVDPGKHLVRATRGDAVAEATVTVAESERLAVELRFPEPARAAAPPAPVSPVPTASAYPADRPATAAPPPAVTSERRGMTPLVPISFGIAGAALITGAITGALAIDQAGRLEEACSPQGVCPTGAQDLLGTHQTVTTVSTIAFSVAGAAAVLGALALILDDRGGPPPKAGARVLGTPLAMGSATVTTTARGLQWTW
jgi:hypothetical protein